MDQKEKKMLFLNRLLAAFVEDVLKECEARLDTDDQIIDRIKDDILGIMNNQFDIKMRCTKNSDCGKNRHCDDTGVCVSNLTSFTWPFLDAR